MLTKDCLISTNFGCRYVAMIAAIASAGSAHAAIITDDNHVLDFGWAIGVSGNNLVVGAPAIPTPEIVEAGATYYYTNGSILTLRQQGVDPAPTYSDFGYAVSLSGGDALVGDFADRGTSSRVQAGAAYYYRNLDALTGDQVVTETLKLEASDPTVDAYFGRSVSLNGNNALVGAFGDQYRATGTYVGAAYYFRDLDTATPNGDGVVTQTLKLTRNADEIEPSYFGISVSLSGDNALVSAYGLDGARGEAYYYRDLPNAVAAADGTVKETFALRASDGASMDRFGNSVSMDGNAALVGTDRRGARLGSAYYYNNLDSHAADSIVTETFKLMASDAEAGDEFGFYVSLSGDNALVGARSHLSGMGSAYFFKELSQSTPDVENVVYETVILNASDGVSGDLFGSSVALNGNNFAIGANHAGKVYTGDIRAFTTLDAGNTQLATEGLSFISSDDWVVGATTSGNSVTVSRDDVTNVADGADVSATDKHVYIGQQAGANNNAILIEGDLFSNDIFVGAAGNSGNAIFFSADATAYVDAFYLALGNSIGLEGLFQTYDDLLDWLDLQGGIDLYADQNVITIDNAAEFLRISNVGDYTLYTVVPEPSTYAALFAAIAGGVLFTRRLVRMNAGRSMNV